MPWSSRSRRRLPLRARRPPLPAIGHRPGRADNFARRPAGLALGVERPLKQQGSGSLVDHGTALPGMAAPLAKRGVGDDGCEALVDEPDRHGRDNVCERFGKVSCLVSGLSRISRKTRRQPDDNLHHASASREAGKFGKVTPPAADRSERAGDETAWVAACDPDPN